MRLKEDEIKKVVQKIFFQWKDSAVIEVSGSESKIEQDLIQTFTKELQLEDELNQQVDKILNQYEAQFESGDLDRRKMFQMVKNQIAKEKKIIL